MISGLEIETDEPFDLGTCKVWLALDEDAGRPMKRVLFGVGGGVLDKGGVCINWKEQHACYVEIDDSAASDATTI
jgi:hypothetical protein